MSVNWSTIFKMGPDKTLIKRYFDLTKKLRFVIPNTLLLCFTAAKQSIAYPTLGHH